MSRARWALLAAAALVAAAWANGAGTWCALIAAGVLGAVGGWIVGHRIER